MNKQQLLDAENPTPKVWATQQLVIRLSKTRLEAVRRVFKEVNEVLYKSATRNLTFADTYQAIEIATEVASGQDIDIEPQHGFEKPKVKA